MIKKITGVSVIDTSEGRRITYTYSIIDDAGVVKENNVKEHFILLDQELSTHIIALEDFIYTHKLQSARPTKF